MNETQRHPETLLEAVRYFSEPSVCHKYMVSIKWADGNIVCPKCGGDQIGEIKNRRMFQCKAKTCRKQFSTKVGTIFEDSALGLDKWFVAVWYLANTKNGTSSCELARAIGVTQKSAWHMLHRVRLAMKTPTFTKISGEVEADESFIGGKAKNMHKAKRKAKLRGGTGSVGKSIVHGLLQRNSHVVARVIPDEKTATLAACVRKGVKAGSAVYTDAHAGYRGLAPEYVHGVVDHAVRYVDGRVHTNGLENFWSLLKRMLLGTYVSVAPEHLDAYLDEQCHRYNNRKANDSGRFRRVMSQVLGKRLTYARLTGSGS